MHYHNLCMMLVQAISNTPLQQPCFSAKMNSAYTLTEACGPSGIFSTEDKTPRCGILHRRKP